jgi:biotin carboxylase
MAGLIAWRGPAAGGVVHKRRDKAREARMSGPPPKFRGVSDLREFFRTNQTPIYFVSPTAFNLLGMDRWVRNFHYVTYFDSFEGSHPNVFVPADRRAPEFESIEDICNYLLRHPEVISFVEAHGAGGRVVFVMFDDETEELAARAGLRVAHPAAALRHRLDSKIVTTQLGNDAGVPSVPNVLGRAASYPELLALADRSGLGHDLVVQTPYGDSGKTTFFIRAGADWDKCAAKEPLAEQELKVMRRIDHRAIAVEAVLTRHGTLVGPLMNDITGHPELTPYRGGWAGNDYPATLTSEQKNRARNLTERLGDRLAGEGYMGFFEVDFLVDTGTGELYLGELNPRISGISSMTNVTAGAYADLPLFLFHLLEYLDIDYEVDIGEINDRWSREATVDVWSQIIIKETRDQVELLTEAPRTGIYRLGEDASVTFRQWGNDWHGIVSESEAFYLRIMGPGDYRYRGADLGALVTRGRLQADDNQLEERCRQWITGMRGQFAGTPPAAEQPAPASLLNFKMA